MDKLFINGIIKNFRGENYNYIGIKNGRIEVLGQGINPDIEANEIIDLEGQYVLPGFFDSHVHLLVTAINEANIDLSTAKNFTDISNKIKRAKNSNNKIIMGLSMHYYAFEEKRLPTRKELDKMCSDRPVWLASKDWHVSVVNTKALEELKIPLSLEGIEFDQLGVITGRLREEANAFARKRVFDTYSFENKCSLVSNLVNDNIIKKGVTSLVAIDDSIIREADTFKKYQSFFNTLPIEIELYCNTTDVSLAVENNLSRIGGDILLDGSFTSRNAALMENFTDLPTRGNLYFSQDEINLYIADCYKHDLQTGLHAVGDRAVEQALIAHEYASKLYPNKKLRHRIEHAELMSDAQMKRAKALNLIFSMQPAFETAWGTENGMYIDALGERSNHTNEFRKITDMGIVICGGSDSILSPINPIWGIYSAVNHPHKEHRVSIEEAIKMFTINAAYAVCKESEKGEFKKGLKADMVVLDRNIENIAIEEIKDAIVMTTIKDGNIIYRKQDKGTSYGA